MDRAIQLRSKVNHFSVLVIGRANAGKTTLLKRVCNSVEDPEIFSPEGIKASPHAYFRHWGLKFSRSTPPLSKDLTIVGNMTSKTGSYSRATPNFIFHDSRGFESGSVKETEKVKTFIAERAASTHLSQQLHMIWQVNLWLPHGRSIDFSQCRYCLPTDTDRPLLEADKKFFNHSVAGNVPVVAIFTKFDALETKAFTELKQTGLGRREAMPLRTGKALEMLTANFIEPLLLTSFNPSDHLHLGNMHKNDSSCKELIEKTANAINDDSLRLLFVSVQQNNIDLSIFYAVESAFGSASLDGRQIVEAVLGHFQHSWVTVDQQDTKVGNSSLHRARLIEWQYKCECRAFFPARESHAAARQSRQAVSVTLSFPAWTPLTPPRGDLDSE
ncbi:hypothetical protein B0H14DRAFT_3524852 [Mycena olivaceomarginata]|nr:hypothetical protein B0H14DRAFT_3524852 [Mycena olivaceomarginata]